MGSVLSSRTLPGKYQQLRYELLFSKIETREHLRAFESYGFEQVRVESQRFKNRRGHLHGLDRGGHNFPFKRGIREQHHDIGVVTRKAAVFGEFLAAARVSH